MSLPVETPSRIWRRIEEGEARNGEMPSLPSLPGFDESTSDESNVSMPQQEHPVALFSNNSLAMRRELARPSSSSPGAVQLKSLRSTPGISMPLSDVSAHITGRTPNYYRAPSPPEYGTGEEGQSRVQTAREAGSTNTSPGQRPVPDSDDDDDDGTSLTEALASVSRTPSPLHYPSASFDIDESHVSSPKLQSLGSDGGGGSLSKSLSFKGRNFKDVVIHKPYDIRLPALSHSISSLSSSTPSVAKSAHNFSVGERTDEPIDEEVQGTAEGDSHEHQHEAVSSVDGAVSIDEEDHGSSERAGTLEPTFSSDDATPSMSGIRGVHPAPQISSTSLSTPIPSSQHRTFETQPEERVNIDDLATPLPRRKSFLLRVVNSTARPRLIFSTPHPRAMAPQQPATEIDAGFTPGPSYSRRVGPKPRLSHRLSQVHTFQPITSTSSSLPGCEAEAIPSGTNASFVSTASSHDLTVHHRANASFDPVTGPQGVGRFNAGKLNTYLHGLNRRLQEENELLVDKVRTQQMEIEALSEGLQRRELSGVVEDEGAEQWVLEKEEMEKELYELRVSLEVKEKDLADEQKGRMRDKERWKERMVEVEEGVGVIVHDLEKRVECAESKAKSFMDAEVRIKDAELDLKDAKAECQLLRQRAEQAERIMASEKDLGSELRRANDEKDALKRDLHASVLRLQQSEEALTSSRIRTADLEKETSSLKSMVRDLESNLRLSRESAEALREEHEEQRSQQRSLREELQTAQSLNAQLRTDSKITEGRVKNLQEQLSDTTERLIESEEALEGANEQVAISADELDRAKHTVQQLEDALEESDRKISSNDKVLIELREKLTSSNREHFNSASQSEVNSTFYKVDANVLEAELFEANKEIGRLTTLLSQGPAIKVIERAKDRRIDILEKENEDLLARLRPTRDLSANITPRQNASLSGISPMHKHFINMSMKTPRTPGEPLRDTSWLMNVTGDVSTAHLLAEIGRLQEELDFANESVDDKLDKLEEAGLGIVGLTRALENARYRISSLEAQLAQLEDRESQRLLDEADHHGREENNISKSVLKNSNLSMQRRLAVVTEELESLRKRRDEEIASSLGEKAALREAANRLSTEIKYVKEELRAAEEKGHIAEKTKQQLQEELIKAKGTIDDLEVHLLSERDRLRVLSAENAQAIKGKDTILEKLKEIELKMEDTKDRMLQLKDTNIRLETELKVERRSTALEEVLLGNRDIIEQLRLERSRLNDEHCNLQQRLAEASKLASELSARHVNLQNSYDGRRRQLDLQAKEIEDLRALTNKTHSEEHRIHTEKPETRAEAWTLEADIKRVQQQAASFGRDLRRLRDERDKAITHYRHEVEQHERTNKQNRTQLRLLKEQLAHRHKKYKLVTDANGAMEALKLKHKKECKGLFVQIRYLKAKFTRESSLRDDLGYQKHYLLVLLSRFEKSEKRILSTISQIGYPTSLVSPLRLRRWKAVALAVVFILRTRRASEEWREQRSAKEAVAEALENVRRGRLTKS